MLTDGIRDFMQRDWGAVREAKDEYWRERIARIGPQEGWRITGELRAQVLAMDPEWPSRDQRAADLAHHIALSQRLRHADSARHR